MHDTRDVDRRISRCRARLDTSGVGQKGLDDSRVFGRKFGVTAEGETRPWVDCGAASIEKGAMEVKFGKRVK